MNISTVNLLLTASFASIATFSYADKKYEKPNFLIVVCEDISPYLNCFGDSIAVSPNLDGFAEESVRHNRMFTSIGVSAPSRYSLITGRFSSADGANYMRSNFFNKEFNCVPPAGVKCYTEFLRLNGYYCTNNSKTDYQFSAPISAWDEQGNKAHWKNAPDDQPFMSIFNLNVTHESFIWKNSDKPLAVSPESVVVAPYHPDNKIVRHDYAVMYSNIKEMDKQFKKLLDELDNSGKADNTIVIFYSDNGGPLPRAKRELMDSGTLVPFMIRFPDRRMKGTINEDLNMFVDIPATILSLANIKIPDYMHGQAMYGSQKAKSSRKYVFGATDRFDEQIEKRASIRNNRYLYIRNYMAQQSVYRPVSFRLSMPMMLNMLELKEENKLSKAQMQWFDNNQPDELLFDCINDPHQINNLAKIKEFGTVLNDMRVAFEKNWIKPYNKEWQQYEEDYFINKMWPDGNKPLAETPIVKVKKNRVYLDNNLDLYSAVYYLKKENNNQPVKWELYKEPLQLSKGDKIVFRLERIGYQTSPDVEFSL